MAELDFSKDRLAKRAAKLLISTKARTGLYKKISVFLDEGVSLDKILLNLSTEYGKLGDFNPRAIMLGEWYEDISNGMQLSVAMSKWIPPSEFMLIQAGESSGQLAGGFRNATIATEAAGTMKGAIVGAIAYPMVLMVLLFFIVYIFSTKAVPKLVAVKDPETWPGASQSLYHLAQFVEHKWWVVILLIISFIIFAIWSCKNMTGPIRKYFDMAPPWSIYKTFQSSVFLISVSAMMKTGKPIVESISDLMDMSPPYVSWHLKKILNNFDKGRHVGESMNTGFLDRETGIDIKIFGSSESVEDSMDSIGRTSIANSITQIKAISAVLNVGTMVLVAGFIGWVYYSFYTLTQSIAQH
jgi:type II secretory pathway component PulF